MVTTAALLALFVGQPLHGPAAAPGDFNGAPVSFASDPGVGTPGAHHAHLCPLCRAANHARAAMISTPHAVEIAPALGASLAHASPDPLWHRLEVRTGGPRAPPTQSSTLV